MTKDFIQKLTSETMEGVTQNNSSETSDLNFYFENKSNAQTNEVPLYDGQKALPAFLDKNQVTFFSGEYIGPLKCFRFLINGTSIDFPSNWGVFKIILENFVSHEERWIVINENNDEVQLRVVLSSLGVSIDSILLYVHSRQVLLVLFKEVERGILKEVECEFLGKISNIKKLSA